MQVISNPGQSTIKWILRYLQGIKDYGLMFGGQECGLVVRFVDSDYGWEI